MTTRSEWATGFLGYAGWEISQEKIKALVAQASKENTGSEWNPLATTEPAPGATIYNSVGVRNYPSLDVGYGATLATFTNGHYPTLVHVLSDPAGGSAVTYCTSPDLNVWGTGNCLTYLEEINAGDPHGYMNTTIAGAGSGPAPSPEPAPAPAEGEGMVSPAVVYKNGQIDVFQVAGGTLWHKWRQSQPTWSNESLNQRTGINATFTGPPEVAVISGQQVTVTVEDASGRAWFFAQGVDSDSWGVNELP